MKTARPIPDLWTLVRGSPWIDPDDLLAAVESECQKEFQDFRTRLLIRESLQILQNRWGSERLMNRLMPAAVANAKSILESDPGEVGFPTLGGRVKNRTDIETILSFLRELGSELTEPARIEVGGSWALILTDLLRRGTDDIDVVNEVPASVRAKHDVLNRLASQYGLMLTHFQSHYLPDGYQNRLHYHDRFRMLDVYLVDPLDIFVGKLFSRREKDGNDLRMLKESFAIEDICERIKIAAGSLLSDPQFRLNAEKNWYVLFGDAFPA